MLFLVACAGSGDDRVDTTPSPAVISPEPTVTASSGTVTTTPPPAAPVVASAAASWRDRVKADLTAMKTSSPQQLAALEQLAPQMTRARFLRFTSDAIHDPRAASVLLDRLARGGESEEVRAALVEALPRTGGLYADAAVELFATERSALVRGAYVHASRRAPTTHAIALMTRGLADSDAEVQAEAARSAASHPDGKRLATALRGALASSSPVVRAESARTLGILGVTDARADLVARLTDGAADVRLEALRAIDRIEPGSAKSLPLTKLATDEDPRIVALVARLTAAPAPAGVK